MSQKHFLIAAVLLFFGVLILVFLGVVFLLPGYISLRDGSFRNAGAASIRMRLIPATEVGTSTSGAPRSDEGSARE
ncbi:MAG: hypothetical protein AAB343_02715 [Patescibacteria group bacterium]